MNYKSTIRDVARGASVSVSTVSRYLNGTGYVSDATRKRIEQSVAYNGYEPSMVARGLKVGKSSFIVLAVPDISNPFYARMARTIQALCEKSGFAMILMDSGESPQREKAAAQLAQRVSAAGILLSTIDSCHHIAPLTAKSHIPTVGMSAFEPAVGFDVVTVHHDGATNLAVAHLAGLGHRDIAFVGGTYASGIAKGRLAGYQRQMRLEGLTVAPDSIIETGFSQEDGYRAGVLLMKRASRPTAICCANDLLAFGVLQGLYDLGVKVPYEVSVTGVDDIPFAPISMPRLTTVSNDCAIFAREAFGMLLQRITGEYDGAPRQVQIPNELIVRESTSAPYNR